MIQYSFSRFKGSYIPVLEGFETKCREVYKSAVITCSEEPLEEAPEKAKGEELPQCFHLFPIMREWKKNYEGQVNVSWLANLIRKLYCGRGSRPHFASLAPWGVWKLLIRWAVAVPLGYINLKSMIIICNILYIRYIQQKKNLDMES